MKGKPILKKIAKFLNPIPDIGGLEISDTAVRFIDLTHGKILRSAVNLSPGIVVGGEVKNRSALVAALKNLRRDLGISEKNIFNAIITAASPQIYTQIFSVPLGIRDSNLNDAIRLNLEMISPFDIKEAYYDAQPLKETPSGQASFLGAFASASLVDQFVAALEEADFNVIAFEFPAFSLSRLIKQLSEVDFFGSHILADVSAEGLHFLILIKGELYFSHFLSWREVQSARPSIALEDMIDVVVREIKRLVSFYNNRINRPLDTIVLSSPKPIPELEAMIRNNFPLKLQIPSLDAFPELSSAWFPALGAALRALVPRSEDTLISLMAVGTEERYFQNRIVHFISSWRNIGAVVLGFVLVVFLGMNMVLAQSERSAAKELSSNLSKPDFQEAEQLQKQAQEFNRLVFSALFLKEKISPFSPLMNRLNTLSGPSVFLERVYLDPNRKITINGRTASEAEAINFKNRLLKESSLDKVVLPLSSFQPGPNNTVLFSLNFEWK